MAGKDPDLERPDLDDELDIPEFDDSMLDPGGNDNRKPIDKVKGGFYDGLKTAAINRSNQRDMINKALPKGYGKAFADMEGAVDLGQDLYDTARENLVPVRRDLKKIGRYVAGKTKDIFPPALQARLEELVKPEDDSAARVEKIDHNKVEIDAAVSEVFGDFLSEQTDKQRNAQAKRLRGEARSRNLLGAQLDLALQRDKRESSDRFKDDLVKEARWQTESNLLNMMRSGIERMVDYQDRVTASYQRKSLELQYKQFFVARDHYSLSQAFVKQNSEHMDAIVKNTAMPEFLKTQTSEAARAMLRERMLGRAGNFVQGKAKGVRERLSSAVDSLTTSLREGIQSSSGNLEMAADAPIDKTELTGMVAGDMVGTEGMAGLAKKIGAMLGRNETISRLGNNLEYYSDNKSEVMRDYLTNARRTGENTERTGMGKWVDKGKGGLAELAMGIMGGGKSPEVSFGRDATELASEASPYTSLADKSITEIIPGLLSDILYEAEMIRTSDPNTERRVYDFETGEIRRQSEVQKRLVNRALPEGRMESIRDDLTTIVDRMDPDGHLSQEARLAFTRQMLSDASRGRRFDPLRFFQREGLREIEDPELVGEIQHLIKERFLRADGEFRKYDHHAVRLQNESSRTFNRAKEDLPNYQETIAQLLPLYGARTLREAGLIAEDQAPGETRADTDSILDYINTGDTPGQGGSADELSEIRRRFGPTSTEPFGETDSNRPGGDAGVDSRGLDRVVGVLERLVEVQRSTNLRQQFEHVLEAIGKINPLEHLELNAQWLKDIYTLLKDSLGGGPGGGGPSGPGQGPKGPSRFDQTRDRMRGMTDRQKDRWGDVLGSAKGRLSQMDAGRARRELKMLPAKMSQMYGGAQARASAVGEDAISYGRSIGTGMGQVGDRMRSSMNDRNYGGKMDDLKNYLYGQMPDEASKQQLSTLLGDGMEKGRQLRTSMSTQAQKFSVLGKDTTDSVLSRLRDQSGRLKGTGSQLAVRGKAGLDGTQDGIIQALTYLQEHGGEFAEMAGTEFGKQSGKLKGKGGQLRRRGKAGLEDTQANIAQAIAYLQENAPELDMSARLLDLGETGKGLGGKLSSKAKDSARLSREAMDKVVAQVQRRMAAGGGGGDGNDGGSTDGTGGGGDGYWSRAQGLLDELMRHLDRKTEQLQASIENLTLAQMASDSGDPGMLKRLGRGAASGLGGIMSFYGGIWKSVGNVAKGGTGMLGNLAGKMFSGGKAQGDGIMDIYIKGHKRPVMLARDLRAGRYFDQETGDIVQRIDEITGPVIDENDDIVISQYDLDEGLLVNREGKSVMDRIKSIGGGLTSYMTSPYRAAFAVGGAALKTAKGWMNRPRDIYVKGEDKPRLLAVIMKNGGYVSEATGKVIKSIKDIDGAVKDRQGNVVLSHADIQQGLIDSRGKAIRGILSGVKKLGMGAIGGVSSYLAGTYGAMGKAAKGAFNLATGRKGDKDGEGSLFGGLGSSSKKQVALLEEIRDILDERMDKPLRKGGWREQFANDGQSALPAPGGRKRKAKKDGDDESSGIMGLLKKLFGGAAGMLGGGLGLGAGADLLSGPGGKSKKPPKTGGKPKGKLGRLLGGAKKWGGKALGGIGALAGRLGIGKALGAAAGAAKGLTLGKMAAGLGTAAASVLSAPVLLAAGAAAAVGTAGYFAYRHFSRKPDGPLHRVRLAQYGADPDNKDHVGKISLVEDAMEDEIQFEGKRMASLGKGIDLEEVMEDFGVDLEDEPAVSRWLMWFQERFKPVYLSHAVVAKDMTGSADLSETDDMDKELKRRYLRRTQFKGDQMPYGSISPFADVESLPGEGKVNEELTKALKTLPPPSESDRIDAAAEAKMDRRHGQRSTMDTVGGAAATTAASVKATQSAVAPSTNRAGRPVRTVTKPLSKRPQSVSGTSSTSSGRTSVIPDPYVEKTARLAAEGEAMTRSRRIEGNDEVSERAVAQRARQERIARQTAVQSRNASSQMTAEMQRMVSILSASHSTQQSMDQSLKDINVYFQDLRKRQEEKDREKLMGEKGALSRWFGGDDEDEAPASLRMQ